MEKEYIPLTLFTLKGREVLSDRIHDVHQKKINPRGKGESKRLLVNVHHPLFGREEDLSEREWSEAAEEMVEWALTAKNTTDFGGCLCMA